MSGQHEFFAAVSAGDLTTVRRLLDDHPDYIRSRDDDGVSPCMVALYRGHSPIADELAARAGDLDAFEAAAFDDTARLGALVEADPGVVDGWSADGWQPLHLAAFFGRVEAVRLLLDADALPDEESRNAMRVRPLHSAAAARHAEIVWLLIASGVDVDATQPQGWTALHSAAGNNDLESAKALLAAGAQPDRAAADGRRPVDLATDPELVALLAR